MIVNLKNSLQFPEIGFIRKGAAKSENGIGKDLGTKFRVGFFSDNEASVQAFTDAFGSLLPETIVGTLPFNDVEECWDCWYEAYNAGRMIARADGEKFIRLVDPKSGEVKVANGQPYTPFTPGMVLGTYTTRKGELAEIKARPVGRLKIVIPALARMAYMTLHTTSIYDVVHISQQLNALYAITGGRIAGVPLMIRRRMTEITWSKPGGQAARIKKGLVSVEADPEWVKKMLIHMSSMALPGGQQQVQSLLGAPVEIKGETNQVQAEIEEREEGDWSEWEQDNGMGAEEETAPELTESEQQKARLNQARNVRTPKGALLGELGDKALAAIINTIQRNRAAGALTEGLTAEQETILLDACGVCLSAFMPENADL